MPIIALPAHFDGKQIHLDEPFELEPNTKLIVTFLPKESLMQADKEHEAWLFLSKKKLEEAYSEKEPEYSASLLKKVNPDYVGHGFAAPLSAKEENNGTNYILRENREHLRSS